MVTSQSSPARRIAVLLLPVVAVVLAGCGGSDDDSGSTAALPTASSPAPSAPLRTFTSLTELSAATSAQQKIDKTARITISGGQANQTGQPQSTINGDGTLRYDDAGPALQLTEQLSSGGSPPVQLGLVVLPDVAFVRPPPNSGLTLPAGKTWVRIDPASTDPVSKQFGQLIQSIRDNADPTRSFAQFGDAITIVDSAEEQLEGSPAVRYRLRVDMAKAAANQSDAAIKQNLQQSVQSGLTALEYTLWLDGQNRLLRVLVDQPLPQNQGTFTLDAHYRDWGRPMQIDQPPADQVQVR
ncbi:MAG TPA: hypothetical protein VL595_00875 [Pseudonocardia sp.]|nr:hypothetical protein [Pseudonocardia sp.]